MKRIFTLVMLLSVFLGKAQSKQNDSLVEAKKELPIVYIDGTMGITGSNLSRGYHVDASIYYQYKKHLFQLKVASNLGKIIKQGWFLFIPTETVRKYKSEEYAVLYGRSWLLSAGNSCSVTTGLSYNKLEQNYILDNNLVRTVNREYFGFPFELSMRFFKQKKNKFRILYGLIPVGKPTALGRSVAFKIIGNVSKNSYIGVGVSVGLGIHQKYN